MFAVLAHHLGTALVSLDVHLTLGTALDGTVIVVTLVKGAEETVREQRSVCVTFLKQILFETRVYSE